MPPLCTREYRHRPRSGPGATMASAAVPASVPSHAEIARLAYSYWEARGWQHGSALEDWLRAERELSTRGAR
jgi:hypothetical protein